MKITKMSTLKLGFLRFDGTDLVPWINEVERFLKLHQIALAQHITIVSFFFFSFLDNEVPQWYYWLD